MIDLTYSEGFFAYLAIWLLALVILWGRELWRQYAHDWSMNHGRLFHCDRCHLTYPVKESEHISRCPRCNNICTRRP